MAVSPPRGEETLQQIPRQQHSPWRNEGVLSALTCSLFQKRMVLGQLAGNPYRQFVFHVGNVLLVNGKRRYQLVIDQ